MLVLERDIFSDKPSAAIRIALDSNGNIIERLFVESGRNAVKFCNTSNNGELTICEGIDTAVAGIAAGFHPVWSVGEVGDLSSFRHIDGVRRLKILVNEDSDELRRKVKSLKRYNESIIELFSVTRSKNVDGGFSITSSPIAKRRNKKQPEKKDIEFDDVDDFFE
jgi:hypothetical protein